jgi:cell division protein FtsB
LAEKLISEQSVEVAEQERRVDQLEDRRESTAAQMEKLQQTILQVSLSFH